MRTVIIKSVLCVLCALCGEKIRIDAAEVNLVKNPGFEEGDAQPKYWDRVDGLTSFYEKDEQRGGKCIRMYTRVDNEEFHARQKEMKLDNPPPAKKPREIKGEGYETVGGNDGVSLYSEWIDVKPGMTYTLTADVRSEGGSPKIFVKGYTEMPTEIDDHGTAKKVMLKRASFKIYIDCDGSKTWKENKLTFCPTHDRGDVKWMRVMLYGYWPPQNYWYDNIKVVEAGLDAEAPKRWAAHKERNDADEGKEGKEKVKEAKVTLQYIRAAVERFKMDMGTYPPTLDALLKNPGNNAWAGPYVVDLSEDPWGNAFHYEVKAEKYTLKSFGPDGKEGGGDDVE